VFGSLPNTADREKLCPSRAPAEEADSPLKREQRQRVTPEAIAALAAGDWLALHDALALKPWQQSPLHALTPEAPRRMTNDFNREDWKAAHELRRQLEAASREG
jgi:hypothetical protein